jgi:hypothetical protein
MLAEFAVTVGEEVTFTETVLVLVHPLEFPVTVYTVEVPGLTRTVDVSAPVLHE